MYYNVKQHIEFARNNAKNNLNPHIYEGACSNCLVALRHKISINGTKRKQEPATFLCCLKDGTHLSIYPQGT